MSEPRPLVDVLCEMVGPREAATRLRRYFFNEGCALDNWYSHQMLATVAGQIMALEGVETHVRNRSIPNVDNARLIDTAQRIHNALHTMDGLHEWDAPRRNFVDHGIKLILIHRELRNRGHTWRCCDFIERCL